MTASGDFRFRDIALAAYGPSVVNAVGHGAVMPVLALRARELGADVSTAAVVVALLGIGSLLASLPAGALVARLGERRVLTVVGCLDAVAMAAAALTDSVLALGIAVTFSGMTWTAFLMARQGFMIDAVPLAYRARGMSMLGGSMRVGVLVGPLLGAGLIAVGGLTWVFWLAAVDVAGLRAARADHARLRLRVAQAGHRAPLASLSVLRAHRRVLLTLGVAVVIIAASRSLRTVLLPLWAEHVGLSASTTSLIFAAAAAIDIAFFFPGGWLMDTRGRFVVAVPVVASTAVACLLLPLATTTADRGRRDGAHRRRQRPRLGDRDDPRRRHRAGRGPRAVPRRLAPVRRHRRLRRPGPRRRAGRGRTPRRGLPGDGRAGRRRAPCGSATGPAGWTGRRPRSADRDLDLVGRPGRSRCP